MNFLVVKYGILRFALVGGNTVDNTGLMLEDIGHEDIFAEIFGQTLAMLDLNPEEDLLVKQLNWLVDKKFIVSLTFSS